MATPIPPNRAVFSLAEVLDATGGRLLGAAPAGAGGCTGVTTDSREDPAGRLFVALRGERFDGHAFVAEALGRGAALALVDGAAAAGAVGAHLAATPHAGRVVAVDDTLRALGRLAGAHRRRWGGTLVAVAGAAGKTTTRAAVGAMLADILPGRVHATRGNLNNRVGVPMTLLALDPVHQVAVVEIGTNAPGEVAELAALAAPDVGMLTVVDLEHTAGLGDLDGVEAEEGALTDALGAAGIAAGWHDDPRVRRCLARSPARTRLTYGSGDGADVRLVARRLLAPGRQEVTLSGSARGLRVQVPLGGLPGALAAAAGFLVAEALYPGCLDSVTASRALASAFEAGRGQLVDLPGGAVAIDDSYNANPGSMERGIETARELAAHRGGRLWLVLGEMLELGPLAADAHRRVGRAAAASSPAAVVAVQGDARLIAAEVEAAGIEAHFCPAAKEAAVRLAGRLGAADVVLVKASRGVRAERVIADLRAGAGAGV